MAEPIAGPEKVEVPIEKKKSKLMPLIIVGAVLVLLGGGGLLVRNYMRKPNPDSSAANTAKAESSEVSKVKSMMSLDAFLVNLADQDATRFVKVTFRLGLDDPKSGEEYAGDPVIVAATRDKINSILSTKTADAIVTPEGKEQLRKEIGEKVNPLLPKGRIVEVFIMDFVVQF